MSKKKNNDAEKKAPKMENEEVKVEPTKDELLQKELDEQKAQYIRLAAEYDNYRKRSTKEKETIYSDAKVNVLKDILPVVDNLERALAGDETDGASYKKGVEMTLNQLMDSLKKLGVEQFGESDDDFDPMFYNAVMHIEDESIGEQKVVEVFQKGYKHGEKVLREAVVKVAN